jgi:hypothetical protein
MYISWACSLISVAFIRSYQVYGSFDYNTNNTSTLTPHPPSTHSQAYLFLKPPTSNASRPSPLNLYESRLRLHNITCISPSQEDSACRSCRSNTAQGLHLAILGRYRTVDGVTLGRFRQPSSKLEITRDSWLVVTAVACAPGRRAPRHSPTRGIGTTTGVRPQISASILTQKCRQKLEAYFQRHPITRGRRGSAFLIAPASSGLHVRLPSARNEARNVPRISHVAWRSRSRRFLMPALPIWR